MRIVPSFSARAENPSAESANADSLAADKACGSLPPQPAAMVQADKLNKQAEKLSEDIRQLEEKSAALLSDFFSARR